jgi:hypothetical protein
VQLQPQRAHTKLQTAKCTELISVHRRRIGATLRKTSCCFRASKTNPFTCGAAGCNWNVAGAVGGLDALYSIDGMYVCEVRVWCQKLSWGMVLKYTDWSHWSQRIKARDQAKLRQEPLKIIKLTER